MEENKRISDLFERARTEAPKTSFEEVKKHVVAASAVGGVGILAKWAAASFKLKVIIMTATISALTISTLLVLNLNSETKIKTEKEEFLAPVIQQDFEIQSENGVQKTIIYDDNNTVVEVIVDSFEKVQSQADIQNSLSILTLEVDKPATINSDQLPAKTPMIDTDFDKLSKTTKERRFEITEKTTSEELEEIRKLAEAAGIDMKYNARIKKNIIKRLTMTWIIECEDGSSNWNLSLSGDDFCTQVGWEENEKGEAVSFLNDKRIEVGIKGADVRVGGNGTKVEVRN